MLIVFAIRKMDSGVLDFYFTDTATNQTNQKSFRVSFSPFHLTMIKFSLLPFLPHPSKAEEPLLAPRPRPLTLLQVG